DVVTGAEHVPAPETGETHDEADSTEATAASESPAPEPAAPASPFSLLFQAPPPPPPGSGTPALPDDDETGSTGSSRRRNRRRSGEAPRDGDDAPGTTVKVRQPRKQPEPITEPQKVKGSTRLEAKKQRRRDGRDAGRRRPVITEAEFLARRESVDRQMIVRSKFGRIQIGVLEDGVLVEHYVARAQ